MQAVAIISIIQAALAAAPSAAEVVKALKDLVSALFTAKVIDKAQQDALHTYVDACQALALSGMYPDHWRVEPDPQ